MGTIRQNKPRQLTEAINSRPRPPNKPPPPPPPTRSNTQGSSSQQTTNLNQPSSIAKSQNAINEFGRMPLSMRPVVSVNDINNDSENHAPAPPPHRTCPAPPVNLRTHPVSLKISFQVKFLINAEFISRCNHKTTRIHLVRQNANHHDE